MTLNSTSSIYRERLETLVKELEYIGDRRDAIATANSYILGLTLGGIIDPEELEDVIADLDEEAQWGWEGLLELAEEENEQFDYERAIELEAA